MQRSRSAAQQLEAQLSGLQDQLEQALGQIREDATLIRGLQWDAEQRAEELAASQREAGELRKRLAQVNQC